MRNEILDDANRKALGLTPSELKLLRLLFAVPDGEWITSVQITAKLRITQATISEKARKLKERGWIESGQAGYRRTKPVEAIKAEMLAQLQRIQA